MLEKKVPTPCLHAEGAEMKALLRLLVVLMAVSAALALPRPAFARFYCTSEEVIARSGGMVCFMTCVYCIIVETGEAIARDCVEGACWFGRPAV
jgi:hypothetical protein